MRRASDRGAGDEAGRHAARTQGGHSESNILSTNRQTEEGRSEGRNKEMTQRRGRMRGIKKNKMQQRRKAEEEV